MIKEINNWEVFTPSGWSDFKGIKKSDTNIIFTIEFTDQTTLKCTENHLLKYPNGQFLEASQLLIGDVLFGGKIIKNISYDENNINVYDLIDVELQNEYYTNNVVSHNCAHMPEADEIWGSAKATLATGGKAIILSTPNGVGNLFHKLWVQAIEGSDSGVGSFNPIQLPWHLHPDRDDKWAEHEMETYGKRWFAQEYDCDFASSGHTVIDSEILLYYQKELVRDPIERRGMGGDYWIWKYPDYNRSYMVTADVSRGDGEDYSTFHIIDVESLEQVAEFRGKVDTQIFGNMLIAAATEYNNALLVIDNKNIGWSVVQVAIDKGYKNLYYSYKHDPYTDEYIQLMKRYDLKDKSNMVPGFTTTTAIRPVLISKLDIYMREKSPIIYSSRLINELFTFIWLNGKPQAAPSYNDDLTMAFCIGLYIRDTALRLRQMGIELTTNSLKNLYRTVYIPPRIGKNNWEMRTTSTQKENLKWLL